MTEYGPGRSYTNAYFSYILIRMKGSSCCSSAGENVEFRLIPNRSGNGRQTQERRRDSGWLRQILLAMRQSTASITSDKAGIVGIRSFARRRSPQTARKADMGISEDIGRRSFGGESRPAAAAGTVHNPCPVFAHIIVRELDGILRR